MGHVWALYYLDHDQKKMWGFFTLPFLKDNMHMFHTISEPVFMDLPNGATINEGFPVLESRAAWPTQEKKIKFLKDNKIDVEKYIYRPYSKGDQGLNEFIAKARTEISYADTTNSCDILMTLRRMYNRLNSNPV